MYLSSLADPQKRGVYAARLRKSVIGPFSRRRDDTIPVFVLGLQRSGTNMLIDVLHLRRDTEVYSEHRNSRAFQTYRLRDLDVIQRLVEDSGAPYICFKPIADSHRARELMARFPAARVVWIYRSHNDVANSRLHKFDHANRAIRLACEGKEGGGWFAEGLSPDTRRTLRQIDVAGLSEFDLACLTWWARNRIVVENELWNDAKALLVRYETLASDPQRAFRELFGRLGMPHAERSLRFVRTSSIGRHAAPPIDPQVGRLCEGLLADLNRHAT